MGASRSSRASRSFETLAVLVLLAALSLAAIAFFYQRGYLLYYGDAEAHLNIARRILDSRTPGYKQIGTVWLPLPHALMLPLVRIDRLWQTGLAGAIPSGVCFVLAGTFLFAAAHRAFQSRAAALTAVCLLALNPNLLYLQSTAMTEPISLAALAALLYFTVRFRESQSLGWVAGAGVSALAATLTRYEGWFLIPFVTLYFLLAARRRRVVAAGLFGAVASLGPLYWLGHNWWFYGNFLEFYNGPYSARAIYQRALDSGMARYPGDHDWSKAWLHYRAAAGLCAGAALVWLGVAGAVVGLVRRTFWPLALLALPPVFYLWSMHSAGTPIFVPHLWPHSYYNTRYGLAALPLLAFAAAALVAVAPARLRALAALAIIGAGVAGWVAYPRSEAWICWKESQVNSEGRRAWTREAAEFLRVHYRPGEGVMTSFGDLTGIFREAGIPLRAMLHEGNEPHWPAAVARPDLFLRERWAVTISGDKIATAILRSQRSGPRYDCVKMITIKGAPVIEIYRRTGVMPQSQVGQLRDPGWDMPPGLSGRFSETGRDKAGALSYEAPPEAEASGTR